MPCAIVLLPCIVIRSTSMPWRQHVCAWFPDAVRCRVLLSIRFIRAVDMHDRVLLPIGLGLADAKAFVEGAPKVVKEGLDKPASEELAKKLKEAGAEVKVEGA